MKKIRWILIGSILLLFAAAIVVVFKKQPTGDNLPSLRPFVAKERVMYYNPSDLLKSSSATATAPLPPGAMAMEPMMLRIIKVKKIPFDQLSAIVHKDLTAKGGWIFAPWPPSGMPKSTTLPQEEQMIIAYQGSSGIPSPGAMYGLSGALGGQPDHMIMVIPDFANMSLTFGKQAMKLPASYMIMEQKKLSKMDVFLLRIKNPGKNPFASERDMTSFDNDF